MVDALVGLLREHGGEVRTAAEVTRVLHQDGRATGVVLADGEQIATKRAVIANLTPTILFDRLLAEADLPPAFRRKVRRYTYGPGTMMVHLALNGPPQWTAGAELQEFAYLHIAPYVDDLARTYTQSLAGYLPDSPLLIVGQPTAVDPSRAPAGQHILWIQVRTLPSTIRGDAADQIAARSWDAAKAPMADRVIEKLAHYAPGIQEQILARVVYSPADLERHNPNLVGGDSIAGSHHLRQNFLWRPFPGWSTYHTPLDGLLMVGAATWPGGGTNATSGYLAAQDLLDEGLLKKTLMGTATLGVSAALFAFDKWRNAASKEQENKEQDVPVQEATTDARNAPEEQEIPVYTAEQEEQIEIKNK
jgi:phytoene dehydrogenase-like protein